MVFRFPNAPAVIPNCAKPAGGERPTIPLEHLDIVPNQRVTQERSDPTLVNIVLQVTLAVS